MGWDGYQQNICANGHSGDSSGDDGLYYSSNEEDIKCHCGAKYIWWNLVDTTNGSFNVDAEGNETSERIDGFVELEQLTAAVTEVCSLGHVHVTQAATYKIPEGLGHRRS